MNKEELLIVKIGGKLIEEDQQLDALLKMLAQRKGNKILVHGGGKRASELLRMMDIMPRMIDGRRITDDTTLEIVTMVYAGSLNKKIVASLQSMGSNAIGLSGADGNVIRAHKRVVGDIDYGFAGDIDEVNTALLSALLSMELLPVFCAITHDQQGQLLNTNADTIASAVAAAMAVHYSVELIYCFEKNGVLKEAADDHSIIRELDYSTFQEGIQQGWIANGMIPKLDNAFEALQKGVNAVRICGLNSFKDNNGTTLQNKILDKN